jgi:DNA-binding response OmpR family regulator
MLEGEVDLSQIQPEQQTILFAEDEPGIRSLVRSTLTGHGYNVLAAENGKMAIEIAKAHVGPIHLLLSDVMMPELDGPNLAEQLRAVRPHVRVIFMSGYSGEVLVSYSECGFIQKPFLPSALVSAVRDTLAQPPKPLHKIAMVILVLEDDPWVVFLIRLTLQRSGHTLIEAATAEEAFQRFEEAGGQVDLLIADVNLPASSGIRVGLGLRALHSRLRIIITSGRTPEMWNDQDAAELSELPSDSVVVLQNPFLPATLLDKVGRFMLHRRSEPERRTIAAEIAGNLRLKREWECGLCD